MIGYLFDIKEDEIIPGFNDFSVIESSKVGVQLQMLGPILFGNASCRSNVAVNVNVKIFHGLCTIAQSRSRRRA